MLVIWILLEGMCSKILHLRYYILDTTTCPTSFTVTRTVSPIYYAWLFSLCVLPSGRVREKFVLTYFSQNLMISYFSAFRMSDLRTATSNSSQWDPALCLFCIPEISSWKEADAIKGLIFIFSRNHVPTLPSNLQKPCFPLSESCFPCLTVFPHTYSV